MHQNRLVPVPTLHNNLRVHNSELPQKSLPEVLCHHIDHEYAVHYRRFIPPRLDDLRYR